MIYSKDSFQVEKKFIYDNFDGILENFAISRLIYDYYKKVFPENMDNIENLKNTLVEYIPKLENSFYKEEMERVASNLSNFYVDIPKSVIDEGMAVLNGDSSTLNMIINRDNKKTIKVIDFWASWCVPCINEIKDGNIFQKKMEKEYDVEWIYISIDKSIQKWIDRSNELKKYGLTTNQFLLKDPKNSEITQFFDIKDIPRYAILNKHGKLVLNNAPRPSDKLVFEQIIKKINSD